MRKNKSVNDTVRLSHLESYMSSSLGSWAYERENGLSHGSISRWLSNFGVEDKENINDMPKREDKSSAESEVLRLRGELRAARLENSRLRMERDVANAIIDMAEERYSMPLRKNSDAK